MKRNAKIAMASLIAAVAISSALAVSGVHAQSPSNGSGLVDKIATRFNLNKADVQRVFDEDRQAHQAQRQQQLQDRLQAAVDAGKLTAAQRDQILAKVKEMEDFRASLQGKTPAEARQALNAKRTELQQWAKQNNIPEEYVMSFGHHGFSRHGMPVAQ